MGIGFGDCISERASRVVRDGGWALRFVSVGAWLVDCPEAAKAHNRVVAIAKQEIDVGMVVTCRVK